MPDTCPIAVVGVANAATVDDFITAYGEVETVELSNIDSAGSEINCERFNLALLDAYKFLQAEKTLLSVTQAAFVDTNLKRWMMIIARYYLDTIRRRPDVTKDFDDLMARLKQLAQGKSGSESSNLGPSGGIWSEASKTRESTTQSMKKFRSNYW